MFIKYSNIAFLKLHKLCRLLMFIGILFQKRATRYCKRPPSFCLTIINWGQTRSQQPMSAGSITDISIIFSKGLSRHSRNMKYGDLSWVALRIISGIDMSRTTIVFNERLCNHGSMKGTATASRPLGASFYCPLNTCFLAWISVN